MRATPSRTARFMALFRALETVRRPASARLFEDPFALGFLGLALGAAVRWASLPGVGGLVPWLIDRRWPGARPSGVARTRLIDDALRSALREGTAQVVILGAGFDCRAYRIAGIERARVFEVDHPATLAAKRERLGRILGALPAHVIFVAIDLNRQPLLPLLRAAGFDPMVRSFFIWEGVTNYLTAEAVDRTLRVIAAAAPGSRLLFTYVHRGLLDGSARFEGQETLLATLARAGEPWIFGIHPAEISVYLAARGFSLVEDVGASEYRARYLGPSGRHLKGYAFYRAALAEVRARA